MLEATRAARGLLLRQIQDIVGDDDRVRTVIQQGNLFTITYDSDSVDFWNKFGATFDEAGIDRCFINLMGIEIG